MTTPILSLQGVNKSFGPIDVLHDITLNVHAGEVLCLLGDNGAGKSTLIKIMSGVHKPTSGTILMDGTPVAFDTPRDASDRGIATVHQFGGTFPLMSHRAQLLHRGRTDKGLGAVQDLRPETRERDRGQGRARLGITRIDDGDRLVGGCPVASGSRLAIARAVHFGARVLILDEPTPPLA